MSTPFKMKGFSGFGEGTGSPLRLFGGIGGILKNIMKKKRGGEDNIDVPMHGDEAHSGGEGDTMENIGPLDESGNPIFQNLDTGGGGPSGGRKWGEGQMSNVQNGGSKKWTGAQ